MIVNMIIAFQRCKSLKINDKFPSPRFRFEIVASLEMIVITITSK